MSEIKAKILLLGGTPEADAIFKHFDDLCEKDSRDYTEDILTNPLDLAPDIIICGPPPDEFPTNEIGQSLRMHYPNTPIFFASQNKRGFDPTSFIKNGFSEAFILPVDNSYFEQSVKKVLSDVTKGKIKIFRQVQLHDISPDSVLGFDLYINLPANNKNIKYVSSREPLGQTRSQRLAQHHYQSALVSEDQMKEFYKFTAKQLKNPGNGLTETEKAERKEKLVRHLLTGLFTDTGETTSIDKGRQMMSECQEIIKAYVVDENQPNTAWYERLMNVAASDHQSSAHTKAASVSTMAALLSIALGIGDPKNLAFAGLVHDIGLTEIPEAILNKTPRDWTPQDKEIYQKHPVNSIRLMRQKSMSIDDKVCAIIEQHHERFDGTGYPAQLSGPRIQKEAQILAIADELEELTRVVPGKPRTTMEAAIKFVCDEGLRNPAGTSYDPTILRKLKSLFGNAWKGEKNEAA